MPLLKVEAEKLSQNVLERGVIEEIIVREDLYAMLPFMGVNGKTYDYNRENTMSGADWLDPNDPVNESAATFTEVSTRLRILIGDVDVDKFLATTMDDTNNQTAIQLVAKGKAVLDKFKDALVNGNNSTNPKQFDGLTRLVTGGQTITAGANGAAISFSMLDELKDMVLTGPVDCLMMRKGTWRALKQLMRAVGGIVPEMIQVNNFGHAVPGFDGIPVITNDYLPANEVQGGSSATCSVYALRLNEADGLHGLYGGGNAGFVVEDIGTVQNKDASRLRVKWYAGLALKSTKSVARLKGVTSI